MLDFTSRRDALHAVKRGRLAKLYLPHRKKSFLIDADDKEIEAITEWIVDGGDRYLALSDEDGNIRLDVDNFETAALHRILEMTEDISATARETLW